MLFSQMEPPPELEAEFNDWYETEHIPVRLALPGFSRAVRYRECDAERKYLAIYEIDDLAVLESAGYNVVKTQPSERTAFMLKNVKGFTRYTCTELFDTGAVPDPGPYLSAVAFEVPAAHEDDWYETGHVRSLQAAAVCRRVRRYKVMSGDGGPWTHFALHDLASPDAMDNPGRPGQWLFEVISVQSA